LDYHYKENPNLVVLSSTDEQGVEQLDIHYGQSKYIPANAVTIGFSEPLPAPPSLATLPVPDLSTRLGRIASFKEKLEVLFARRPIWTRLALSNELNCDVTSSFLYHALPYVAYMFQQGPWRQCWVKYGVDPRTDIQYRVYQLIDSRYMAHDDQKRSHIYDGKTYSTIKTLQLCDVIDPEFKQMIYSVVHCRAVCHQKDGWYVEGHLDAIRDRIKEARKALKKPNVREVETEPEDSDREEEPVSELHRIANQIQDLLEGNDDDYFELLEQDD
jgi:general transcription factor 3C polypeptide 5 (transcription factor C subunit 1)